MNVWVDGQPASMVSARDRGLQYGDGLFETMSVRNGRVPLWNRHLARLLDGCARLKIEAPHLSRLEAEILLAVQDLTCGVAKLIVTRGVGERGYCAARGAPTRILSVHTAPQYPLGHRSQGVHVRVCRTRLGLNPALAGVKHLNRLEQVMARSEWDDAQVAEGLMLDMRDRVIEGTSTNLFFTEGNILVTPDLSDAGVAGIMRGLLLERAPAWGLETRIEQVSLARLKNADEVFLSNSAIGVWPVCSLEGKHYPVGPVVRKAWEEVRAYCACE